MEQTIEGVPAGANGHQLTVDESATQQGQESPQVEPFRGPEYFEELPPSLDGKEDAKPNPAEDSARYFQSRYDKAQEENRQLREQMQMVLQQQQAMLANFQGGQPQVSPAAVGESVESLQRPEKPVKPQDYNPIDATTNPNSDSWHYREALESFPLQMAEYMERTHELQMRKTQEQSARQAQEARLSQMRRTLSSDYSMSAEEQAEFFRVMDDPQVLTMDNLVKLYRIHKGQAPVGNPTPRSRMPLPPVPTGPASTGRENARSDADVIMDDLIRMRRARNPLDNL